MAASKAVFGCVMAASTVSLSTTAASGRMALAAPRAVSCVAAARTAAALGAWQRNASEAAHWAHPSWWAPALDLPAAVISASFGALREVLAGAQADSLAACSWALLQAVGAARPKFDGLRAPDPAVLDALPVGDGLRVLRMRALLWRRAEVRRLIDKQSRLRLAQWVGVPLERLSAAPRQGAAHAPAAHVLANETDVARLVARGQVPALEQIDEEGLACEGYALIARNMHEAGQSAMPAREPRPCSLLRLALPRDMPPWPGAGVPDFDGSGTALFFAHLPELVPEWAWLFG
ncbi:type III secretion protein HrpB4 [Paraburkholderia sp. BR14320]|uniref:type III secretion protein HrpB4 n=1 Tax=unclassified Paraburkholderia TaxID=2615204 RepID=UPI0034CE23E0